MDDFDEFAVYGGQALSLEHLGDAEYSGSNFQMETMVRAHEFLEHYDHILLILYS